MFLLYSKSSFLRAYWVLSLFFLLLTGLTSLSSAQSSVAPSTTASIINQTNPDDQIVSLNFHPDDWKQIELYELFLEGSYLKASGDLQNANLLFRDGIQKDSTVISFYLALAESYMQEKDFGQATVYAHQALVQDPENARAYFLLGSCYSRLNKHTLAIADILMSLSRDSDQSDAESLLGEEYLKSGDLTRSINHFQKAILMDSNDILSHYQLGNLYLLQQDYAHAAEHFQKVTRLNPNVSVAFLSLAQCQELLGNTLAAESAYLRVATLDPTNMAAHISLGSFSLDRKDYSTASSHYAFLLTQEPNNPKYLAGFAECLFYLGNIDKSSTLWEGLSNQSNYIWKSQYFLGLIADQNGKKEKALTLLMKALTENNDEIKVLGDYLEYFMDRNQLDRGVYYLDKIQSNFPQNWPLYLYLGISYAAQGDKKRAMEYYQTGWSKSSTAMIFPYQIGYLYLAQGKQTEAIQVFKKGLEVNPQDVELLNSLGFLYADKGIYLDDAEKYLKQAVELSPNKGYVKDSLGWVYYHKGKYKEARDILIQAAELSPNDWEIQDHLGDTCMKLKQYPEAKKAWELSLRFKPENKTTKRKLDDINRQLNKSK